MVALSTPHVNVGWRAPDFFLTGTDGHLHSLDSVRGEKGLLVMFICNHCPYVRAILDRIIRDAQELKSHGVNTVAISANDPEQYPQDSLENMAKLAEQKQFPFPYCFDETQEIAKAYGAVCTPDFFGFNADLKLHYRGRLDESQMEPVPDATRELFEAMRQIAAIGTAPAHQHPSVGCSIKWREEEIAV